MENGKKLGRPRKKVKEINTVRQVGRWTDEDWNQIRAAAKKEGLDVATWCKRVLKRCAKRIISRS